MYLGCAWKWIQSRERISSPESGFAGYKVSRLSNVKVIYIGHILILWSLTWCCRKQTIFGPQTHRMWPMRSKLCPQLLIFVWCWRGAVATWLECSPLVLKVPGSKHSLISPVHMAVIRYQTFFRAGEGGEEKECMVPHFSYTIADGCYFSRDNLYLNHLMMSSLLWWSCRAKYLWSTTRADQYQCSTS